MSPPKKAPPRSAPASARSPSETGMLKMVPLGDDAGEDEGAPKSATQFFAIPQPKKKAKPASAPSQPVSSGPPPAAAPVVIGGPIAAPGAMPPGVGGPMGGISGPVAMGAQAPIGAAPGMAGHSPDEDRAKSYRVFAIVIMLMGMVFAALIVTVGLAVVGIQMSSSGGGEVAEKSGPMVKGGQGRTAPHQVRDTGKVTPPPPNGRVPRARPRPKARGGGGGGGGGAKPKAKRKPKPKPAASPGTVVLKIPADAPYTGVEIRCPSTRKRGSFSGGKTTVSGIPAEDCTAFFKGGPPQKTKVTGGQSKTCTMQGPALVCK